jgi:serine/threonine protein kinase
LGNERTCTFTLCISQGNILITRDGKACIADYGILGVFKDLTYEEHKLETLRYMAPERLSEDLFRLTTVVGPTEASDIYSLAMSSFEVRSSVINYPTA